MTADTHTPAALEHGKWLFAGGCEFKIGAMRMEDIPDTLWPEVVFCGLSNVGKSSLINALTNRKTLARVSHTPGRTRQINFFLLREVLMLVDLPGYGYAKVSKKEVQGWSTLIHDYLKGSPNLRRVCLLVDSRRGLKQNDKDIMKILDEIGVVYQVVLTKTDKVKKEDVTNIISAIKAQANTHPALHPDIISTSSRDASGIDVLRAEIASFVTL
jgi:GTP-binding protein